MVLLSPTTDEQEFNIMPRDPSELSSLSLTITDEASDTSETFSPVTAYENGDYIGISQAFTILKEHRLYNIEITQDGELWWRGRARCTSQSDKTVKHKLNTIADGGSIILSDSSDYTIIE